MAPHQRQEPFLARLRAPWSAASLARPTRIGTAEFWSAVDYPFHYEDSLSRCLDLVSEYTVLYVGVFCPIDVLEQREAARGDRKTGLARYQSARIHENSEYDVEVETHELSPNQAAQKIISALETIAPPTAFERLR
jgi:chloramphenicol 3-O phosphotransferase